MHSDLVDHFLHQVSVSSVMTYLEQVSAYDRYQASQGIEQAASLVADTARDIGLVEVSIEQFPADGTAQWWSFRAPISWTPKVAKLGVMTADGLLLEIDHAKQPFSVATYSAATPCGGVTAPLVDVRGSASGLKVTGAIAIVGRPEFARSDLLPDLIAGGAVGFVTDAPCCDAGPSGAHPGRIELDPGTPLFGFSVTSHQLGLIRNWVGGGIAAYVEIVVDRSASMPIVTGVLPGERSNEEVWLIAHLCHPRPGANDNASGVAALLGVASALVASRRANASSVSDRSIRFLWGPEFLGTAAMMHQRMGLRGKAGLPSAVIDLDMVGEDQALCGSPFIVERNPDFLPALISPIAEHIVGQAFAQTSTYYGTWCPMPFTGFSDHALFADPNIGCAAVQFCHAPDRFNHSAADTLDKVSPVEMLRATAASASLAQVMATDGAMPRAMVEQILTDWCAGELTSAQRIARRFSSISRGDWGARFVRYVERRNAAMLSCLQGEVTYPPDYLVDWPVGPLEEPAVVGCWLGPLNVRAMLADLPAGSRAAVANLIRADKNNYSLLLNFGIRANGRRSRNDIIEETSFALQRPVDELTANLLFGALIESGWVKQRSELPAR